MDDNIELKTTIADHSIDTPEKQPTVAIERYTNGVDVQHDTIPQDGPTKSSFTMAELDRIVSTQILPNKMQKLAKFGLNLDTKNKFTLDDLTSKITSDIQNDTSGDFSLDSKTSETSHIDIHAQSMRMISANASLGTYQFQKVQTLPYMRKSLSLGYQHVDILKKISAGISNLETSLLVKLDAIKVNTGTPDTQKFGMFSRLKNEVRGHLYRKVSDNISRTIMQVYDDKYKKYIAPHILNLHDILSDEAHTSGGINGLLKNFSVKTGALRDKLRETADSVDPEHSNTKSSLASFGSKILSGVSNIGNKPILSEDMNKSISGFFHKKVALLASMDPFSIGTPTSLLDARNAALTGSDPVDSEKSPSGGFITGLLQTVKDWRRDSFKSSSLIVGYLHDIQHNTSISSNGSIKRGSLVPGRLVLPNMSKTEDVESLPEETPLDTIENIKEDAASSPKSLSNAVDSIKEKYGQHVDNINNLKARANDAISKFTDKIPDNESENKPSFLDRIYSSIKRINDENNANKKLNENENNKPSIFSRIKDALHTSKFDDILKKFQDHDYKADIAKAKAKANDIVNIPEVVSKAKAKAKANDIVNIPEVVSKAKAKVKDNDIVNIPEVVSKAKAKAKANEAITKLKAEAKSVKEKAKDTTDKIKTPAAGFVASGIGHLKSNIWHPKKEDGGESAPITDPNREDQSSGGILGSLYDTYNTFKSGPKAIATSMLKEGVVGRTHKYFSTPAKTLKGRIALAAAKLPFKVAYAGVKTIPTVVKGGFKVGKIGFQGAKWAIPKVFKGATKTVGFASRQIGKRILKPLAKGAFRAATTAPVLAAGIGVGAGMLKNVVDNNTTGGTKRLGDTLADAAQYGAMGFEMGGPVGAAIGAGVGVLMANLDVVTKVVGGLGHVISSVSSSIWKGGMAVGKVLLAPEIAVFNLGKKLLHAGRVAAHNLHEKLFGHSAKVRANGIVDRQSKAGLFGDIQASFFGRKAKYSSMGELISPGKKSFMPELKDTLHKKLFGDKPASVKSLMSVLSDDFSDMVKDAKEKLSSIFSSIGKNISGIGSDISSGVSSGIGVVEKGAAGIGNYVGKAASNVAGVIDHILGYEGGAKLVTDDGGLTKYGISQKAHPNLNISSLTEDQAKSIYMKDYGDKIKGLGSMSPAESLIAYDAAINQGPSFANEIVAKSGGDLNKMISLREQRYEQLATSNPQKYGRYLHEWNKRLAEVAKDAGVSPGGSSLGGQTSPKSSSSVGQNPPTSSGSSSLKPAPKKPVAKSKPTQMAETVGKDIVVTGRRQHHIKHAVYKDIPTSSAQMAETVGKDIVVTGRRQHHIKHAVYKDIPTSSAQMAETVGKDIVVTGRRQHHIVNIPSLAHKNIPTSPMQSAAYIAPVKVPETIGDDVVVTARDQHHEFKHPLHKSNSDITKLIEQLVKNAESLDNNTQAINKGNSIKNKMLNVVSSSTSGSSTSVIPGSNSYSNQTSSSNASSNVPIMVPVSNTQNNYSNQDIVSMSMKKTMVQTGVTM